MFIACLDTQAREIILCLYWGLNLVCPVCSQFERIFLLQSKDSKSANSVMAYIFMIDVALRRNHFMY
jgi:hypothetical protein